MTALDKAGLVAALATYDAAAVDCPARKRHLGDEPCPKCGAGTSDGCGLEIGATHIAAAIRELTTTSHDAGDTGGEK